MPPAPELASRLATTFPEGVGFWSSGFGQEIGDRKGYGEGAPFRIWDRMLAPGAWQYCRLLTDLRVPQPIIASHLAAALVDVLESGEFTVEQSAAVAGLSTSAAIEVDAVSIRPMTPEQIGEWLPDLGARILDTVRPTLFTTPTHCITIRGRAPASHEPDLCQPLTMRSLLVSLQVLGFTPAAPAMSAAQIVPTALALGRRRHPIGLPTHVATDPSEISADDLREACRLATNFDHRRIDTPSEVRDVPLHRFHLGMRRDQPVDRVLDFTIGLESLLSGPNTNELSLRMALNGATWIAEPGQRRSVFDQLRRVYSVRSQLVHGSKFPARETIVAAADSAQATLQRGLLKAYTQGWPTNSTFDDGLGAMLDLAPAAQAPGSS
jgi:hypothetical protein